MRVLFIGESWLGSCARSLKEALGRRAEVELDEVNEDAWFPRPRARLLRALNRLTAPSYRREFGAHVLDRVRRQQPDVVVVYKGFAVRPELLAAIRDLGPVIVNVYPDFSPHAYGHAHRQAVGAYDIVISTKPFHPALWKQTYGYDNRCVFVPQGYDPALHLASNPPSEFLFDLVLVATYRATYGELMVELAQRLGDRDLSVAVGGNGWGAIQDRLPRHWCFPGAVQGRGYVSLLRQGKICIAPLTHERLIDGHRQPGDVDTTRTYELPAAHCFFIHQRTDYARGLYGEDEVPMYEGAAELAAMVRHYLGHEDERVRMAATAHRRAVPAYSLDQRASEIVHILQRELAARGSH